MRIVDTFDTFPANPSIENLRAYYDTYHKIFNAYFPIHCKNTDERLHQAILKYRTDWDSITLVHERIASLIETTVEKYKKVYQLEFPISVNLIIGAYGSNAYTHRQIIPDITFAMERLTYEKEPLQVIIAHEFGHAAHNIFSNNHEIDWKSVNWNHPYTWLLQEGAATHFSKQIVPGLDESIYFSYKYGEDDWLEFAKGNKQEIIQTFIRDMHSGTASNEIFKEWFSINGGNHFGFNRLGYYIADCMFQDYILEKGELHTLLLWKEKLFIEIVEAWLSNYK
ncbi:hypothetical protein [Ornithinibacillus sp. FSL M8-0202]|uniref:hypothetical protein n=1 Tax=unclassified Ornithinibacillus TaxID=2620869 RepID=UPI0030D4DD95